MIVFVICMGLVGWLSAMRFGYGLADIEASMTSTIFYGILSLVVTGAIIVGCLI